MYSIKYILLPFIILLLSCSTQDGYKIKGESSVYTFNTDNSTISLYEIKADNILQKIDSTQMYSVSKFSITQNSDNPIKPKIGLILVDNKIKIEYNIIYLEQGFIYATIKENSFNIYNTYLNDKKYALDKIYLEENSKIQEEINQYLKMPQQSPIDSATVIKKHNNIKILQYKLFAQILDSINTNQDNLLGKGNTLINYYKVQNIKENGNNIFGSELFLEEEKNLKGYELDFALAALSDSIKHKNQRFSEYK